MIATIDRAAADAIVRGDHGDPFAVLGMHHADDAIVVRALLPQARRVHVVDRRSGHSLAELPRVFHDGLFAGAVPDRKRRFAYRLRLETANGEVEIEDPYRFGTLIGEETLRAYADGRDTACWLWLGAHPMTVDDVAGTRFALWAPNARRVSVVGPFNDWDGRRHPMRLHPVAGVWEIFLPGIESGTLYKYEIIGRDGALLPLKADPCGAFAERPPSTASVVWAPGGHAWSDAAWLAERGSRAAREAPIAVYEVHAGSWRRKPEEGNRYLTWRELADTMVPYVQDMGFTHVELMPVSEFPFDGSWGYQPIGLFAPTSRFGTPDDFHALIDRFHQAGIGVILDWVPGHFPSDAHGLGWFDGTHLYEHEDPRKGRHMDWDTLIYNYGRNEVQSFLLSGALHWIDEHHVDALRVDAVASMLYLDYSRKAGEWVPNIHGGRENLEAVAFLRRMNESLYGRFPDAFTVAEESTAWPMVSRPTYLGGLGFGYKWNMGWMHDTLQYISRDPVHRRYHHDNLTFGLLYAFTENFILPLSHDEVVHGKGSLLGRMPGDRWQRFANLRLYFGFMYGHPGKKLLFMGGEFAQEWEWNHDSSLDWHLLDDPLHRGVQRLVRDLNRLYREVPALHRLDCEPAGFEWIDATDADQSVLSFLRLGDRPGQMAVVVCNFTPVLRHGYRVGAPQGGVWLERLNTDSELYGGGGIGNLGRVVAEESPMHGRPFSLSLTLPPLATVILVPDGGGR